MTEKYTYPASGNETHFLPRNGRTGDCRGFTDMLMVTTTVRMIHRVHGNTTSAGPATKQAPSALETLYGNEMNVLVTLSPVLVVRPPSLQQRLINPSTTSHNPNRRPRTPRNRLLRTARQTDASLVFICGMSDHRRVVPRRPCECTTVTELLLNVAYDGSLGALAHGEDVSYSESCFFAAVDEGASVHAFGGDEGFFTELVAVGVPEDDLGEGCTADGPREFLRIRGVDGRLEGLTDQRRG
jgi:hypothetical protein